MNSSSESKPSNILYISDFPEDTEESDIKEFFKQYTVLSCQFVK